MADFSPDYFQGKSILVTGGTGFLGSHLIRRLVALRARVVCLLRPTSNRWRLQGLFDQLELLEVDLAHGENLLPGIRRYRPEIVFHLAAYGVHPQQEDLLQMVRVNLLGLGQLFKALEETRCKRFVNTGTCFEYGNPRAKLNEEAKLSPLNPYAASKTMAWHLCNFRYQRFGFPVVTLRPFTFFGPMESADRLIPATLRSILLGEEIRITSGEQTRDYTYVEDVVHAYLLAAMNEEAVGHTFNIGSGRDYSVLELAEKMRELMKSPVPMRVGALETRRNEVWNLCCDPSKAQRLLGWKPAISLEEGLLRTAEWMKSGMHAYHSV